jgi:hypothetical protein
MKWKSIDLPEVGGNQSEEEEKVGQISTKQTTYPSALPVVC